MYKYYTFTLCSCTSPVHDCGSGVIIRPADPISDLLLDFSPNIPMPNLAALPHRATHSSRGKASRLSSTSCCREPCEKSAAFPHCCNLFIALPLVRRLRYQTRSHPCGLLSLVVLFLYEKRLPARFCQLSPVSFPK